MRPLPVRLPPGCDLRHALESLADPRLRLAGESEEARYEGPFEILTLSGTVTPQGAHLLSHVLRHRHRAQHLHRPHCTDALQFLLRTQEQ